MTLNDRERFILHSMSVMVVDLLVKRIYEDKDTLKDTKPMNEDQIGEVMEDIRKGRCRKMSEKEMGELYEEMKEEMLLGSEIHRGDFT